jgi:hypothetical protein
MRDVMDTGERDPRCASGIAGMADLVAELRVG